jgi:hypothetical protein
MASVHLENVGVEFTIHDSFSRSLRHELYRVFVGTLRLKTGLEQRQRLSLVPDEEDKTVVSWWRNGA